MIYIALVLLGLCLGSFINALVWRVYKQAEIRDKKVAGKAKKLRELSIVKGRSMCLHCHHELAPKDLIPVVSWLYLRGKCRYCRKLIDDTPLAELVLPLLFVVSYAFWPLAHIGWGYLGIGIFATWLAVLTCLVALAIYDAKWYLLPDRIVLPLTLLALVMAVLIAVATQGIMTFVMALLGGLTISGIFLAFSLVSKGAWIGGGDVKIGLALGLLAGTPLLALLVIFVASLLGTLFALPHVLSGQRKLKSMLPFGPFLIAATYIVVLWGHAIYAWYFGLFLQ